MPDPFDRFPLTTSQRLFEEVERSVARDRQENEQRERVFEDMARSVARKREQDEEKAGFAWTMFKALREQVEAFEQTLAPGEETAAWLANFGANVTLVITEITYRHPHLLILKGEDQDGRPRELLQHVSQVSLLLTAIPAKPDRPGRRIGFRAVDADERP